MNNILKRYLALEITLSSMAVILVLTFVMASNAFVQLLAKASSGSIDASFLFELLIYDVIRFFGYILSFGLFIGSLLAFGRFYRDSEMAAMQAVGFDLSLQARAVLLVVLPVFVLSLVLAFWVRPWANAQAFYVRAQAESQALLSSLAPGQFNTSRDEHKAVFFMDGSSEGRSHLQNVFSRAQDAGDDNITFADSGILQPDDDQAWWLQLKDGVRLTQHAEDGSLLRMNFRENNLLVRLPPAKQPRKIHEMYTLWQLWQHRHEDPAYFTEIHWRLSGPVSMLILVLWSITLSRTSPRQGRYGRLFLGVLIFIVYSNLLGSAQALLLKQQIPQWLGMWWLHALVALMVWLSFRRVNRPHAWLPGMKARP